MPDKFDTHHFEKYSGKDDPNTHVTTFTAMCSDFYFEEDLLAKLFP